LEKEIQQEQWIRKMEPFRRFLGVAAQMNGKIINREKISREVGVENSTIASYYEVLEDTLLGFELPAFHHSIRKAQRQAPKFYFFDTGVKRAVERTLKVPLLPQTAAFGEAFEHWLILELMKIAEYRDLGWKFHYLRTKDDVEIDLVVERPGEPLLLIEIKSKARVDSSDAKALRILGKDLDPRATRVILSQDPLEQSFEKVRAVHYRKFLQEIGG
ncbi:MAG: DUF4143 domain-containing protein, partial [Proteobacteria bacterium]|nr:DUF4143 domain-containing protein [Pseudomonadota bacterium]